MLGLTIFLDAGILKYNKLNIFFFYPQTHGMKFFFREAMRY